MVLFASDSRNGFAGSIRPFPDTRGWSRPDRGCKRLHLSATPCFLPRVSDPVLPLSAVLTITPTSDAKESLQVSTKSAYDSDFGRVGLGCLVKRRCTREELAPEVERDKPWVPGWLLVS